MPEGTDKGTEAYLARIRRTIEESNRLVEQVGLRIQETDRMLERQGLTREQVMAMRFSDAQIEAANAELERRGLDPLEKWESDGLTDQEEFVYRSKRWKEIVSKSGEGESRVFKKRKEGRNAARNTALRQAL